MRYRCVLHVQQVQLIQLCHRILAFVWESVFIAQTPKYRGCLMCSPPKHHLEKNYEIELPKVVMWVFQNPLFSVKSSQLLGRFLAQNARVFSRMYCIMFAFDLFAGVISLLEHNEDYVITFPSTYCRCVFLRYFNFRSDCRWKTVRGANG